MREAIGETAGKIWNTLGQRGEVAITTLPKLLKEKPDVVFQALGWLAHEGKIVYRKKESRNLISLTDSEKEVFRTIH